MPLADPHSAGLCPEIEALGFFFCGIIPEKRQGDVIRFEYLNNIQIDLSQVIVVSDFGRAPPDLSPREPPLEKCRLLSSGERTMYFRPLVLEISQKRSLAE